MIGILDAGFGNIGSISKMLKLHEAPFEVTKCEAGLSRFSALIIPGIGTCNEAMKLLESSLAAPELTEFALSSKKPVLGICVGMQIMSSSSDEGETKGLGWISSKVESIRGKVPEETLVPNMGWDNVLVTSRDSELKRKLNLESSRFYFSHSYAIFEDRDSFNFCAKSRVGDREFIAAYIRDNIFGVQFHPEKSGSSGKQFFSNYIDLLNEGFFSS